MVKSTVEILQNFEAFSEYINFKLEKVKDMPPVEEPAKLARWIIHNSCNLTISFFFECEKYFCVAKIKKIVFAL